MVESAVVMDASATPAEDVRRRYGFAEATSDLARVLDGPTIDVVSVALPNVAHREVLDAIICSGQRVLTEKPLGLDHAEAELLARLAAEQDAVHAVGFSYRRIPALAELARVVAAGRLGGTHHFESSCDADHAASPECPFAWRFDRATSGGVPLIDLGVHAIDAIDFAVSPINEVLGADLRTHIAVRRDREGREREGTNDDVATAIPRTASAAPFSAPAELTLASNDGTAENRRTLDPVSRASGLCYEAAAATRDHRRVDRVAAHAARREHRVAAHPGRGRAPRAAAAAVARRSTNVARMKRAHGRIPIGIRPCARRPPRRHHRCGAS